MTENIQYTFDVCDPYFLEQGCRAIIKEFKPSETSNSSGKFFRNYECWHFHKSGSGELIVYLNERMEKIRSEFERILQKPMNYDFFVITRVMPTSEAVCLWHKDGYFFDGQVHFTVVGHSRIECRDHKGEIQLLEFPNGTLWYLNGSVYLHRIQPPLNTERLEICIPINQRPEDVAEKRQAILDIHKDAGYLCGSSQRWIDLRRRQARYVQTAVHNKTASNLDVAAFSVEIGKYE